MRRLASPWAMKGLACGASSSSHHPSPVLKPGSIPNKFPALAQVLDTYHPHESHPWNPSSRTHSHRSRSTKYLMGIDTKNIITLIGHHGPERLKRTPLSLHDIVHLDEIAYSGSYPPRIAKRALIVRMRGQGKTNGEIEFELRTTRKTIRRWWQRFSDHGVEGILHDAPLSGRKNKHRKPCIDERIDVLQNNEPPDGLSWSNRDLARECHTKSSKVHRILKAHNIPLSRDGLKMMFYIQSSHPISDIPGLFVSPTLKAAAFQIENEGYESESASNVSGVAHDIEEAARPASEGRMPVTGSPAAIHLMMVRTDAPGNITHLQIPIPQNGASHPSDCMDISSKTVAFYHYKVHELVIALEDAIRVMSADGKPQDMKMLVFLECIDRRVAAGKEVALVMNSLAHDLNDRVSTWLARHSRFRVSFFPDDGLWLEMVTDFMNRVPDEYKRRVTFRLEYMLAEIAEKGGKRGRPIICYMPQ